jgi:hypothetical protein
MKILAGTALMTLFLALPATVLALGMETFGNAPAVKQPDWADGVVDVVNLKSRIYSQEVNGNENFFYRDNAQALNEALRKYAAVKADVRQLILLPGSGKTMTFGRKPIEFDWQLHVPSGLYKAVAKKSHAVMTVYINANKPRGTLDRRLIEKWLGDLDSDSFPTREKARVELQKLGNDGKPFLREALKANLAVESRRRIEGLLDMLRDLDVDDLKIPKGITVITVDDLLAVHLKGLKEADSMQRGRAVQELSALISYSDKVIPAQADMLKNDKDAWVRSCAAAALRSAGVKAKSAMPVLQDALKDSDAYVRDACKTAIEQIENAKGEPAPDHEGKRKLSILKEINELKKAAGGK